MGIRQRVVPVAGGGRKVCEGGEYELDFRDQGRKIRESNLGSRKPNAKAVVRLSLMQGTAEDGDPRNRLIEIAFDRYPGKDVHARQDALISALFGWEDSIKRIRHDGALETASRRAKARLPALRKAFAKGLAPGEYIQVKAPFATPTIPTSVGGGHRVEGRIRAAQERAP
jgi:hypothetical protein